MSPVDSNEMSPELYEAIVKNDAEFFEDKNPSDITLLKKTNGDNGIHIAIRYGRINIVEKFLERFPRGKVTWEKNSQGDTPLHIAAEVGDISIVELLYDFLKDLATHISFKDEEKPWRLRNSEGNTPLHVAIIHQNVDVAEYLLDKDQYLACVVNNEDEAPLHLAVTHHIDADECHILKPKLERLMNSKADRLIHAAVDINSQNIIKKLVKKESCVALFPDKNGLTPLHRATMLEGHIIKNLVSTIIENCPQSAQVCDALGNSILHKLAGRNIRYYECVELLNEPYIYVLRNHQNKQGDTPLHIATYKKDNSMAKALLCAKAKLRIKNKAGISIASLMQQNLVYETREMTLAESQAADEGNADYFFERIKYLDNDFLLAKDSNGRNILHKLMHMENKNQIDHKKLYDLIVHLLIEGRIHAIESLRDLMGDTPIHVLMRNRKPGTSSILILKELIKIEATQWLLLQNELGNTPLHEAIIIAGDRILIDNLVRLYDEHTIQSGVWLLQNELGNTPLHLALIVNDTTLVRALLEIYDKHVYKGPWLLVQNLQGNTPIHLALIENNTTILNELVLYYEKHTDEAPWFLTNAQGKGPWLLQNAQGNTPVHEALIARNFTLVRELLEYDSYAADIFNVDGKSPLHLIARYLADCEQLDNEELKSLIGAFEVVVALLTENDGQTMWHSSVLEFPLCLTRRLTTIYKDDDVFKDLVKKSNHEGKTPLHLAIDHQRFGHATLIFQFNPQTLESMDNERKTVLHYLLLKHNNNQHVDQLINQCLAVAKTNRMEKFLLRIQDHNGVMPLHLVIESGDFRLTQQCFELVQEDIAKNVDLAKDLLNEEVTYRDNNTLLHLAIEGRHFGLVYDLLALAKKGDPRMDVVYVDKLLEKENKSGTKPSDLLGAISDLPPKLEELILGEPKFRGIRSMYGITKPQMKDYVNTMGVIAALLATISFTAAFTVPGGLIQEKGTPIFIKDAAFQMFMVFNVLTMCLSMVVLFCLLWILAIRDHRKSVKLMDFSMSLLQISFYTILIAFMTGVYATIQPVKHWMALYALVLCSFVTVTMRKYYMVEYIAYFGVAVRIFVDKILPHAIICHIYKSYCKKRRDKRDQHYPPV